LAVQKKEDDMSVFVIAAVAAAIFLAVAFVGVRSGKSSNPRKREDSDSGVSTTATDSAADCGAGDGGGCGGD
jgi:uncharacterized low-complexity protein